MYICLSNVLQIVMYLGGIMGGSHFFTYSDSYIVCLFALLFCGVAATTFYIFCTLLVHHFPVEGKQFMQQYSKPISKACHRHFNAKSNVHSMNIKLLTLF